jgi:phage protein U
MPPTSSRYSFTLMNLESQGQIDFRYFPPSIATNRRANWEAQPVIRGTQPLQWSNRDPVRISINDLYLDKADINASIKPEIEELHALMNETERGTPPALLAMWGDEELHCVLEEIDIDRQMFMPTGEPLRARVSLRLIELQQPREHTSSVVRDSDEDEVPPDGQTTPSLPTILGGNPENDRLR